MSPGPAQDAPDLDPYDEDPYDEEYPLRRTWAQRSIIALGVLAVMGCLAAVGFISYEAVRLNDIERRDVSLAATSDEEPQNWLIVGSDSRDAIAHNDPNSAVFTGGGESTGGQRSDTIMIVRLDPKGEHLDILSLQRDLWLPIARTDESQRINTAYSYPDGPQRLVDTIRQNFNIEINHYVEINFASFEGIVNAIGGVPMYFDKPMRDANSGLDIPKAGCQKLDGYQALAFARSRHLQYSDGLHWVDDPSGDLGRISRQQYFMRHMFDQAAGQAFSSPKSLHDLIEVAQQYVGLDTQIDITKAIAMGQRFGQFEGDSIKSYSLPVTPFTTAGGAAVLKLDPAGSAPILNIFRGIPEGDAAPEDVPFAVVNASGVAGQGAEVIKAFQVIGYQPSGPSDAPAIQDRTQVRYAPGSAEPADQVSRHLTSGADLVEDASLASGKVVLVTGKDFTTVMRRPLEPTTATTTPGDAPTGTAPGTTAKASGSTTTVKGGKASTTTSSSTTTTAIPLNNTDTDHVGVIPGKAPDGVVCE